MHEITISALGLLLCESDEGVEYSPELQRGLVKHEGRVYQYNIDERGIGVFYDESGLRVYGDLVGLLNSKLLPIKRQLESKRREMGLRASRQRKVGKRDTGIGSYLSGRDAPDWLIKYDEQFKELEDSNRLLDLHTNLDSIFKDSHSNYRLLADDRDFVAILPTPASFIRSSPYRGVYVFRKVAGRDIHEYAISSEDRYFDYIPKIANKIRSSNLLDVRQQIEGLDLGMFFRRDRRLNTITSWIPDSSFDSYDELAEYTRTFVEGLTNKLCGDINEVLQKYL